MNTTRRTAPSFDRGGDRNYDRLPQADKDAVDFLNWATERGARDEKGARIDYAAHAARHLRRTAPERFAKAVVAWKARGQGDAVYATLVAMAEQAAQRTTA